MRAYLTAAAFVGLVSVSTLAGAHGDSGGAPDKASTDSTSPVNSPSKTSDHGVVSSTGDGTEKAFNPWHGSILLFDQSVTTTTVGLGKDYISADPVYEWWFALKPRYSLYESKVQTLSLSLWMNLYYEVTNSDSTTTAHEPVIGPTWLSASYNRTLFEGHASKTSFFIGPRLGLPTDKASRNTGQIVSAGASMGLSQSFPLAGKGAPVFPGARLGVSSTYTHPFTRATTPVDSNLEDPRQDLVGRLVQSDQLGPRMNVNHSVSVAFSGDVQVTSKIGFSASYVMLNSWAYWPKQGVQVCPANGGCNAPLGIDNATNHRVNSWVTASIDYDALDEMSISIGYYNLATQLGPDGQRRSPLWSPDARIFLTATGNLDAIYDTLTSKSPRPQTASR